MIEIKNKYKEQYPIPKFAAEWRISYINRKRIKNEIKSTIGSFRRNIKPRQKFAGCC